VNKEFARRKPGFKSISIDPNIETAYRYRSTLDKQKEIEAARDRYIEAFITEPDSKLRGAGLVQWGEATKRTGPPGHCHSST